MEVEVHKSLLKKEIKFWIEKYLYLLSLPDNLFDDITVSFHCNLVLYTKLKHSKKLLYRYKFLCSEELSRESTYDFAKNTCHLIKILEPKTIYTASLYCQLTLHIYFMVNMKCLSSLFFKNAFFESVKTKYHQ